MTAKADKPLLLTVGEPAGIGPEILVKAFEMRHELALPPVCLIGGANAIEAQFPNVKIERIDQLSKAASVFEHAIPVLDIPFESPDCLGTPSPANASTVLKAIETAAKMCLSGEARGMVTSPIHKAALIDAGFNFMGHTDYLADLCCKTAKDAIMMLASKDLRVVPLTQHMPLKDVPKAITHDLIVNTANVILSALSEQFGINQPHLAITGLNPHAGEDGKMGDEEITTIIPAIKTLKEQGHHVTGPHPADALFTDNRRSTFDAALAMYHDQALIPLKTVDFRHGVNVTLGLPLVRTSPDHGTALEIAGHGHADPSSLIEAIRLADRLSGGSQHV